MSQKKENQRLTELCQEMILRFGPETGENLGTAAKAQLSSLMETVDSYPKALQRHLRNNIFPAAAVFLALLQEGRSREEAAALTDELFSACMEKPAAMIQKICRIPGFYRILPWIWKKAAFRLFGPEAGFAATMYKTPASRVKFDMTACPYLETCRKIGCPEIAFTFCHTDDICYGHMHNKLIWNRTQTLARGGTCCDFDLYAEK